MSPKFYEKKYQIIEIIILFTFFRWLFFLNLGLANDAIRIRI